MSGRGAAMLAPTRKVRGTEFSAAAVLAALFALLGAFIFRPGVVDFDGAAHYAYLPSALVDGNFEFANAIVPPEAVSITPTGHAGNQHPIGPAILWAPAFLGAHIFCLTLGAQNTALCGDDFAWPYVSAISVASALYGFAGLYVILRVAGRLFEAGPAFAALLALWLASPLVAYMYVVPSMPHALSFGVASAFLAMWWIVPARHRLAGWFIWGQLGGVLAIVRWQDVIWLILPVSVILIELVPPMVRQRKIVFSLVRPAVSRLALLALGLVLVFSPQMIAWNALYGTALTIPQGQAFMQWTQPMIVEVLFSARHGLFTWMPLALAACAGLLVPARRHLKLFVPLMLILVLYTYVNAAAGDWWGGGAFGPRRFVSIMPILFLGLAGLFQQFWRNRAARIAMLAVAVICVLGNWILITEFYTGMIQPDQALTWVQAFTIATTRYIPLDRWLLLYPGIVGQWHTGPYGTPAATVFFLGLFLVFGTATLVVLRWLTSRRWAKGPWLYPAAMVLPVMIVIVDLFLWRIT